MRRYGLLAALACVGLAGVAAPTTSLPTPAPLPDYWGGRGKFRRGKRPQAKPKKRSNLLTVSKRVRRKHRRAA